MPTIPGASRRAGRRTTGRSISTAKSTCTKQCGTLRTTRSKKDARDSTGDSCCRCLIEFPQKHLASEVANFRETRESIPFSHLACEVKSALPTFPLRAHPPRALQPSSRSHKGPSHDLSRPRPRRSSGDPGSPHRAPRARRRAGAAHGEENRAAAEHDFGDLLDRRGVRVLSTG